MRQRPAPKTIIKYLNRLLTQTAQQASEEMRTGKLSDRFILAETYPVDTPLGTYLHDHLSGAELAVNLLTAMKERHAEEHVQHFVRPLLIEIDEDRSTLREIAERVGSATSTIKEAAAWLGEKASRAKLGSGSATAFAEFEALEFLALGVLGKMTLWRTLQVLSRFDTRLRAIGVEPLISRQCAIRPIEARRSVSAFARKKGDEDEARYSF